MESTPLRRSPRKRALPHGSAARSMASSPARSVALAAAQLRESNDSETQSRTRPFRSARPANLHDDADDESEPETEESASPNVPVLKGDPYSELSGDDVATAIWTFYPDWKKEKLASSIRALQLKYKFAIEVCCGCQRKSRQGVYREWVRCVGIMEGNQCRRMAHFKCNQGELFLCFSTGCSSHEDRASTESLVYLFYHAEAEETIEDDGLDFEMKKFRLNHLAKSTQALLNQLNTGRVD